MAHPESVQVMVIKHYYSQEWAPPGINPNVFEKALSYVENTAKGAVEKLTSSPIRNLTEEEAAGLLVYMDIQRICVPRQAKMAIKVMENIMNLIAYQIPEVAKALENGITIKLKEKEARFRYMKTTTGTNSLYYFHRMLWEVFTSDEEYLLLPIVRYHFITKIFCLLLRLE